MRAILGDPRNDSPRLIFADWLDEHDWPEQAGAMRESWLAGVMRFIRVAEAPLDRPGVLQVRQSATLSSDWPHCWFPLANVRTGQALTRYEVQSYQQAEFWIIEPNGRVCASTMASKGRTSGLASMRSGSTTSVGFPTMYDSSTFAAATSPSMACASSFFPSWATSASVTLSSSDFRSVATRLANGFPGPGLQPCLNRPASFRSVVGGIVAGRVVVAFGSGAVAGGEGFPFELGFPRIGCSPSLFGLPLTNGSILLVGVGVAVFGAEVGGAGFPITMGLPLAGGSPVAFGLPSMNGLGRFATVAVISESSENFGAGRSSGRRDSG